MSGCLCPHGQDGRVPCVARPSATGVSSWQGLVTWGRQGCLYGAWACQGNESCANKGEPGGGLCRGKGAVSGTGCLGSNPGSDTYWI